MRLSDRATKSSLLSRTWLTAVTLMMMIRPHGKRPLSLFRVFSVKLPFLISGFDIVIKLIWSRWGGAIPIAGNGDKLYFWVAILYATEGQSNLHFYSVGFWIPSLPPSYTCTCMRAMVEETCKRMLCRAICDCRNCPISTFLMGRPFPSSVHLASIVGPHRDSEWLLYPTAWASWVLSVCGGQQTQKMEICIVIASLHLTILLFGM